MARIAFVLADDFEDSEFKEPYDRLRAEGHELTVVGKTAGKTVTGKKGKETFTVEAAPDSVSPADFDALVIPGGYSPDKLRMDEGVVKFVKGFFGSDKPVAAICHAGAEWLDREVVVDGNLITSRKPDDLPAFCEAILDRLDAHRRMGATSRG